MKFRFPKAAVRHCVQPTPMYSAQLCIDTIYFELQPARCLTLLAARFT